MRTTCGKVPHATFEDAQRHMASIRRGRCKVPKHRDWLNKKDPNALQCYKCEICGFVHVGHDPRTNAGRRGDWRGRA